MLHNNCTTHVMRKYATHNKKAANKKYYDKRQYTCLKCDNGFGLFTKRRTVACTVQ